MNYPGQNSQNPLNSDASPWGGAVPVADLSIGERLEFIRKTYSLFMLGILASLVMGTLTLNVSSLYMASAMMLRSPLLMIVLFLGLSFGAQAVARVPGLNLAAMFAFTGFMGFALAPMLAMYESTFPGIVGQAGGLTFLTFAALTAYAFISKKDFSFMGGILFVGVIALIGGGILNLLFFKSSMMSYLMAWATLMIFSGFVLYDTSNIMRTNDRNSYVAAALGLYINFINIFLSILRILSGSRSSD